MLLEHLVDAIILGLIIYCSYKFTVMSSKIDKIDRIHNGLQIILDLIELEAERKKEEKRIEDNYPKYENGVN